MTSPTSAPIADFDYVSTENFDGEDVQIGWVEYSSCTEGWNAPTLNAEYTSDELLDLAEYAVTVKILPSSDVPGSSENAEFAVMADMCSAPVHSLNNGYTISHFVDESGNYIGREDGSNWIGSTEAVNRMWTRCQPAYQMNDIFYWGCGNVDGLYSISVFVELCELRQHSSFRETVCSIYMLLKVSTEPF